MVELAFPSDIHRSAREHLLGSGDEEFGFFLAGLCGRDDAVRFCVREFLPIGRDELVDDPSAPRDIQLEALLRVTNAAKQQSLAVVEAHSHPFTGRHVTFSQVDLEELPLTAKYMLDTLDGRPYAATVWGKESIDANFWTSDGRGRIERIRV